LASIAEWNGYQPYITKDEVRVVAEDVVGRVVQCWSLQAALLNGGRTKHVSDVVGDWL
jgi:hypothetical protein